MPVPMTGIKSTSIVFSDETKEVEPCARLVESRLRRPPGLGTVPKGLHGGAQGSGCAYGAQREA